MGTILQPTCKCEFPFKTLFVFGGFQNFNKVCDVPTPCYKCGTLFLRNILKPKLKCPKCRRLVSYFGKIVDDSVDEIEGYGWRTSSETEYILEDKKYKCPVCNEDELTFQFHGNWD